MSNAMLLLIIIPTLLGLLVGIPMYLRSRKREIKEGDKAWDSMIGMTLAQLQSQSVSLGFEQRVFRELLLSPSAVEWLEFLLRRTFEESFVPGNYAFLLDKYVSILKQLVQRLQPWSEGWTAKGTEPVGEIRLKATTGQWTSNFFGFDATVAWLATFATEESRLAATVKDFSVPQWDRSILEARCELDTSGFVKSYILTTRLHGASLPHEINRISQPLLALGDLNDTRESPK